MPGRDESAVLLATGLGLKSKLNFAYSPFIELAFSLNVLYSPGRRGALLPWVMRFKEKTSGTTQDRLTEFGGRLDGWMALVGFALKAADIREHAVDTVLARLARLSPAEVEAWFGLTPEEGAELVERLRHYWRNCFHEEFYWIEPLLVRSINEQAAQLQQSDALVFLQGLYPEFRLAYEDGSLAIGHGGGESRFDVERLDEIILFPSLFVGPQTLIEEQERALLLSYAVAPGVYQPKSGLEPPEQLSRLLKTLADETRLKIVKLLTTRPWCTQDLAVELELSEPTVSRHLKLLREAELIDHAKRGNFIYYSLRLERIAEMHMKLLDFLRS